MNSQNLTLLSEGQIWGNSSEPQLEVIRKYGIKAAITDLCVLTGSYLCEDTDYNIDEDKSLTGRTGWCWTRSDNGNNDVCAVHWSGGRNFYTRSFAIFCNLFPNLPEQSEGIQWNRRSRIWRISSKCS